MVEKRRLNAHADAREPRVHKPYSTLLNLKLYIGDDAARLSDRHAKWCATQAAKDIDQSKFEIDSDVD